MSKEKTGPRILNYDYDGWCRYSEGRKFPRYHRDNLNLILGSRCLKDVNEATEDLIIDTGASIELSLDTGDDFYPEGFEEVEPDNDLRSDDKFYISPETGIGLWRTKRPADAMVHFDPLDQREKHLALFTSIEAYRSAGALLIADTTRDEIARRSIGLSTPLTRTNPAIRAFVRKKLSSIELMKSSIPPTQASVE